MRLICCLASVAHNPEVSKAFQILPPEAMEASLLLLPSPPTLSPTRTRTPPLSSYHSGRQLGDHRHRFNFKSLASTNNLALDLIPKVDGHDDSDDDGDGVRGRDEYHTRFGRPLWYLFSSMQMECLALAGTGGDVGVSVSDSPLRALALAKEAVLATQRLAEGLAENSCSSGKNLDGLLPSRLVVREASHMLVKPTVRSGRLLERRSKNRGLTKNRSTSCHVLPASTRTEKTKKNGYNPESNDALKLFLGDPQTKQVLSVKKERELIVHVQEMMRLEEVKTRLCAQFAREPTFAEWAEAVEMSCWDLRSCLDSGNLSREKLLYANFLLVVHVAKKYQGKGLDLQDLLQVGSMGLMKSLEKFKPKVGCRFPTYAYWWIRQSIKKAIFQHSRTIRLPENVYARLKKIKNARMSYIKEKGYNPKNEDLAKLVGLPVEKLEKLLAYSRSPVSIQKCVWADQDVLIQEVTADPSIETPDLFTTKQMMRQHACNLLNVLPSRERQIIRLRYGIHDGEQKTLTDIGNIYGVSKERIRQLESRALDKLKDCLRTQGLEVYVNFLT